MKGYEKEILPLCSDIPTTQQFILPQVDTKSYQPIAIDLRTQRLNIINRYMNSDRLIRIQYSAKAAGIANGEKMDRRKQRS